MYEPEAVPSVDEQSLNLILTIGDRPGTENDTELSLIFIDFEVGDIPVLLVPMSPAETGGKWVQGHAYKLVVRTDFASIHTADGVLNVRGTRGKPAVHVFVVTVFAAFPSNDRVEYLIDRFVDQNGVSVVGRFIAG